MSRPKLPEVERKSRVTLSRMTPGEFDDLARFATALGVTISEFIRLAVAEKVRRVSGRSVVTVNPAD